jgi:hypothetical protein
MLSALDFSRYTPRIYIISEGDSLSAEKATALEEQKTMNKVCDCILADRVWSFISCDRPRTSTPKENTLF